MKYLALGDSYTIGESVPRNGSFPFVLAKTLETNCSVSMEVIVIAKTGWTTDELKTEMESIKPDTDYDLVTLLIGVNNQYRGYPTDRFKVEFEELLASAIGFAKSDNHRVLAIAIPDYGCTPFGDPKSAQIDLDLREFNRICKTSAGLAKVNFIDIFETSKLSKMEPDLIATDQLHPSQKMYEIWVDEMVPFAEKIVRMP